MRSFSPMTRRTIACTCTSWTIAAKIPQKALPCTDGRRNTKNFLRNADVGNDSLHRAFPLPGFADPARGARVFLRGAVHDALLDDSRRRADGNSSGAERVA